MAVNVDIFNPQVSVVAKGLEGKCILIFGGNNRGKTYVATHMSKPYVTPFLWVVMPTRWLQSQVLLPQLLLAWKYHGRLLYHVLPCFLMTSRRFLLTIR